jgi:hypothetical protein
LELVAANAILAGMLKRTSSLVTIAVTGAIGWAARTAPALASCAPGTADKPDLGFVDSNCDGIDGDKAAALFVAPNGDDNNDGSFGHPKATVANAVTAALAAGKDVYVAAGTYAGKPAFLGNNGRIGVYGGYDPQTWQRSAANVTTLEAPGQVVGVAVPGIVLQLLTVHSTTGGTTSYGVRAFGSVASVALSRVTVVTSNGLGGSDGAAPAAPPAAAPDGAQSVASCGSYGGAGGSAAGVLGGGHGGDYMDDPYTMAGADGDGDFGVTGGMGGVGGYNPAQDGGAGTPGHPGSVGPGGTAALNRVSLFFQAMAGTDGTGGTRGAGGGGGAGATDICTPGSGGGAGGRPGAGGKGGQGGGGSIGVFAGTGSHVLVLDATTIHTANGGKGGLGAAGQGGGAGGKGGAATSHVSNGTYYEAGAGGNGGWGGQGGQGGGGAGGPSVGVLAIDSRAVVSGDSAISVGAGGAGGVGAYDGAAGVAEKTAQVTTAGGSLPAVGDFDGDGIDDAADECPIAAGGGTGCPAPADPGTPVAGDTSATASSSSSGSSSSATTVVSVSVLPAASCVRKAVFRIRIDPRKAHLRSARLTLDGHRLKLVRGKRRWTARVDLRHSSRTRHTLVIRGRLRDGRHFRQTRHYLTCGAT